MFWETDKAGSRKEMLEFRSIRLSCSCHDNSDISTNGKLTRNNGCETALLTMWKTTNRQHDHKLIKIKNKGKHLFSDITTHFWTCLTVFHKVYVFLWVYSTATVYNTLFIYRGERRGKGGWEFNSPPRTIRN